MIQRNDLVSKRVSDLNLVTDFFLENYKSDLTKKDFWKMYFNYNVKFLYTRIEDNICCLFAYLKINDSLFEDIRLDPRICLKQGFLDSCLRSKGDNVHFILAISNRFKDTISAVRWVILHEAPKSISWFKYHSLNLRILKLRGDVCHL